MRAGAGGKSPIGRSHLFAGQIGTKQLDHVLCGTVGGTAYPVPAPAESPGHLLKNP